MSSATSQSNTVLKQSTGSAKIGTSRNKTIQDVINQQEIVFDLMVSLRNESGLPLNSKVKNNQGVMYKITDSPQSVDNFIPSNISVDDDALFIKLNDGAKWACVEPESALHYISSNQPLLLANVSHKMRTQAAIKIATYGDSTTFCQGTINKVGDVNKVGVATNFGDGSIHANWQIQTPWPEHLRLTLNSVLSVANISVENRGFSGDSIYQLVKRHTNNPISDLSLIMCGINDCAYATSNHINQNEVINAIGYNLKAFRVGLIQKLFRETMRGSGVILMTCVAQVSNVGFNGNKNAGNVLTEAYNDVTRAVAKEFGVPCIESYDDILSNYPLLPRVVNTVEQAGVTHDGVHFSDYGSVLYGKRLAAALLAILLGYSKSNGNSNYIVANIFTRKAISNGNFTNNMTSQAPVFDSQLGGSVIELVAGQSICFPIYVDENAMVCYPVGIISIGGVCTFDIDLATEQPQWAIDGAMGHVQDVGITEVRPRKSVTYEGFTGLTEISSLSPIRRGLVISGKGWHLIKFSCAVGSASVSGLELIKRDLFLDNIQRNNWLDSLFIDVATSTRNFDKINVDIKMYDSLNNAYWYNFNAVRNGSTYSINEIVANPVFFAQWLNGKVQVKHTKGETILGNKLFIDVTRLRD